MLFVSPVALTLREKAALVHLEALAVGSAAVGSAAVGSAAVGSAGSGPPGGGQPQGLLGSLSMSPQGLLGVAAAAEDDDEEEEKEGGGGGGFLDPVDVASAAASTAPWPAQVGSPLTLLADSAGSPDLSPRSKRMIDYDGAMRSSRAMEVT